LWERPHQKHSALKPMNKLSSHIKGSNKEVIDLATDSITTDEPMRFFRKNFSIIAWNADTESTPIELLVLQCVFFYLWHLFILGDDSTAFSEAMRPGQD